MIRVCVHDKIIDVRMQKLGTISDKNWHIMAILPSYAITQTLSLTNIEDGILMVVVFYVDVVLLPKSTWLSQTQMAATLGALLLANQGYSVCLSH